MHLSMLILSVVLLLQCSSALAESSSALDADAELDDYLRSPSSALQAHHLFKRQSTCPFFFLDEPPSTIQCLPQPNRTLSLNCRFLSVPSRQNVIIGWFFSLDGIVASLVQVNQFDARNLLISLVASESRLEVRK